jgi:hypothetical protein
VKPSQPNPSSPREGKKRYSKPELQTYGRLMDVTQALGASGNMDGAKGNPSKTAP